MLSEIKKTDIIPLKTPWKNNFTNLPIYDHEKLSNQKNLMQVLILVLGKGGTLKLGNKKKQLTINLCMIILKTFVMICLETITEVGKLTRVRVVILIGTQKIILLDMNMFH